MAALYGHAAVHESFSAAHFGASLIFSWNFPSMEPYMGIGGDRTKISVKESLADPSLTGEERAVYESRFTLGINMRPYQNMYISIAGNLLHWKPAVETSMGIRF
ncbi:MAG: hypothetical protein NTW04_02305 [Elusimicrobia bacterium]|nr:hypothetical protein [Elusimicrobiota bacterium]